MTMSDAPRIDPGSQFARSLVDAGKAEQPPAGATARAFERLARGSAATATSATGAFAWTGGWTLSAVVVLAAAAGVALAVQRERGPTVSAETPAAPTVTAPELSNPTPTSGPAAHAGASTPAALGRGSLCERTEVPDDVPTVCSVPGRHESMQMVNTCGDAVDVYWVDFKCRESFVAKVAPGETFGQSTYDTHPWRVRDHATRRLIKEWVGPRQPEPPATPVQLPDIVIRDGASATDGPPQVCSHPSDKASLRFVNQRTSGVSVVFWVDDDCKEEVYERLEPGATWTSSTFEAHPWRVRDETGALLVDFVPEGPDQTVYVALP
jgi:hypothetical protein